MVKKQLELNDYQMKIKQAHHEVKKQLKTWKAFLKQPPTLLAK